MNSAADVTPVDETKFTAPARLVSALGYVSRLSAPLELITLAQTGHGLDPRAIPVAALQFMSTHPAIYLAEQTLCGIVRRQDLYSIEHDDQRWVKQTEAWLWPLLGRITAAACRAFAYGTVAVVFDWGRTELKFTVPTKEKGTPRARTAKNYTRFMRAVEVHPDLTHVHHDAIGEVEALTANGQRIDMGRAHLWAWDPELGETTGQSARRRAWRDYCESLILSLLQAKYLERSVDPARVAFCPPGTSKVDGQDVETAEHVNNLLMALQGSGAVALPSTYDKNGNPLYRLDQLAPPDRSHVWRNALDRCDRNMILSYLVAPTVSGVETAEGSGAARMTEGMLKEFVQNLATWIAEGLTAIVAKVCRANPLDCPDVLPEVRATDVGKAGMLRILQQVLTLVNAAPGGEVALCTNVAKVLDTLQVPTRDPSEAPEEAKNAAKASAGASPDGGQPTDFSSERQDRREKARTNEGAEDRGGDEVEREERAEAHYQAMLDYQARSDSMRASQQILSMTTAVLARMDKDPPPPPPPQPITVNVSVPEREVINNLTIPEREVHVDARSTVDARTTVSEGAVRMESGAVKVDAPVVTVPEREVNITLPPGGGTKRVTFSRGLDGKIVGAETKED